MSLTLRLAEERGHANHGWLDTHHSFSFADYYDPAHMGFRDLRVINDDVLKAAAGFPTHGHKDMEIISYVVRGALLHKDTTGGEGVLRRGDIQTMSAGTGVRHSEFNGSQNEDARLLQIWILPESENFVPRYSQAHFSDEEKQNHLRLVVAPDNQPGTLPIHQDVRLYASLLDAGASVEHNIKNGRAAWIQLVDGSVEVNGASLKSGDGAQIEDIENLRITAQEDSEFLLFDLV